MSVRKRASVTRKNKRSPLPCHELYSKSHVLNALMTFNMPRAFLINLAFNIMLLMCVLCMQARRCTQTPPDAMCSHTIWQSWQMSGFLGRGLEAPCWQRGGLDGYLWRDANAAGHGCFTGRNVISKQNPCVRHCYFILFDFPAIYASVCSSAVWYNAIGCLGVNIFIFLWLQVKLFWHIQSGFISQPHISLSLSCTSY